MANITSQNFTNYLNGRVGSRNKTYYAQGGFPSVNAFYGTYDSIDTAHKTLCAAYGDFENLSEITKNTPCGLIPKGFTVAVDVDGYVVEYQYKKAMPAGGYTADDLEKKFETKSDVETGLSNYTKSASFWEDFSLNQDNGYISEDHIDDSDLQIEEKPDGGSTKKFLKFADRSSNNGMGYVILRTDKTLSQQVTDEDTVYEIRYDFDLNNTTLTIPENCILNFVGGSISGGGIVFNNTKLIGTPKILCNVSGDIASQDINVDWFIEDNDLDEFTERVLGSLENVSVINYGYGRTYVKSHETGHDYSNMILNGNMCTINVKDTGTDGTRCVFKFSGSKNVIFKDFNINDNYAYSEITGDKWRHIICIIPKNITENDDVTTIPCENIHISNVVAYGALTEAFYVDGNNITIDNCTAKRCGRNCMAIIRGAHIMVTNCTFIEAYRTAPKFGIDIEPNDGGWVNDVTVENCIFDGNKSSGLGISLIQTRDFAQVEEACNINVSNCIFRNNGTGISLLSKRDTGRGNVNISNCSFYNQRNMAIQSRGWSTINAPIVNIDNIFVRNTNLSHGTISDIEQMNMICINTTASNIKDADKPCGNIHFSNVHLENDKEDPEDESEDAYKSYTLRGMYFVGVSNCSVKNLSCDIDFMKSENYPSGKSYSNLGDFAFHSNCKNCTSDYAETITLTRDVQLRKKAVPKYIVDGSTQFEWRSIGAGSAELSSKYTEIVSEELLANFATYYDENTGEYSGDINAINTDENLFNRDYQLMAIKFDHLYDDGVDQGSKWIGFRNVSQRIGFYGSLPYNKFDKVSVEIITPDTCAYFLRGSDENGLLKYANGLPNTYADNIFGNFYVENKTIYLTSGYVMNATKEYIIYNAGDTECKLPAVWRSASRDYLYDGFSIYDTSIKKRLTWNGEYWINNEGNISLVGKTSERPDNLTSDNAGVEFYSTNGNKLYVWDGTQWNEKAISPSLPSSEQQ